MSSTIYTKLDELTLPFNGGDIVGEGWGKSKERVEIPINNYKDRQTYYGALNLLEPDLIVAKYSRGNGENTVKVVENLQKKCRKKIVNILG
ncbi:hypothetical protein [Microcoleus sp. Pol12A5]|uniref:hypothetical protein n=1 Tax=Microcoleus sp. Pol12A5 TaxID=3055392 RepID=UPI002FD16CEF